MAEINLDGRNSPIKLGQGFTIRAPGLKGTARILGKRTAGTRGPELATDAFDHAFAESSIEEVQSIELEVSRAPFPTTASPLRGPEGSDAFELITPDLGSNTGQVVLSIDEAGAMHWHFPVDAGLAVQPSSVRGAGGSKVFRIPREIATSPPSTSGQNRGLVNIVGRKILKVLIYPVTDAVFGPLTELAIGRWEAHKRPHYLRRFLTADRAKFTPSDWTRVAAGRALLFVHGTFSTADAAFGGLPSTALGELADRYSDRLFAFEHPTLSVDPKTNAEWFFSQFPPDVSIELDIICHSRGGLVSRYLGASAAQYGAESRFRVSRLVLAGVPNQGTILTDPDHIVEMLDRYTSALNVFPDNFATDILEGILTTVKVIGHAGLKSLDGLAVMKPGNTFLSDLDNLAIPGCEYYGIGGDFEPRGVGFGAAFCTGADSLIDRVFQDVPNDLVVPFDGMRHWSGRLQILDNQFLTFNPEMGVAHTNYFKQHETATSLLRWLA